VNDRGCRVADEAGDAGAPPAFSYGDYGVVIPDGVTVNRAGFFISKPCVQPCLTSMDFEEPGMLL